MSTWSEARPRGSVLRGGDADGARPARMDAELSSTAFAPRHVVDARLTDPHLQDVVEQARRTAVEQGRLDGHAQGYAAGLAAAQQDAARTAEQAERARVQAEQERSAQVGRALEVLARVADTFRRQEHLLLVDVEDTVARLAVEVARAVLDREVALSCDPGGDALARALVLAPDGCPVTARLHPDDAAALACLDDLAAGREVVVLADPAVERGGCVVEAAGRHVDAQIGPALERVAAVLR